MLSDHALHREARIAREPVGFRDRVLRLQRLANHTAEADNNQQRDRQRQHHLDVGKTISARVNDHRNDRVGRMLFNDHGF